MKTIVIMVFFVSFLFGCSSQYGETEQILNESFTKIDSQKQQTKVTVVRSDQFQGSGCNIKVAIDGVDMALLASNKFVTFYLERGVYLFKVNNQCDIFGIRKSWQVFGDGVEQEYFIEHGMWGQLRSIRTK